MLQAHADLPCNTNSVTVSYEAPVLLCTRDSLRKECAGKLTPCLWAVLSSAYVTDQWGRGAHRDQKGGGEGLNEKGRELIEVERVAKAVNSRCQDEGAASCVRW